MDEEHEWLRSDFLLWAYRGEDEGRWENFYAGAVVSKLLDRAIRAIVRQLGDLNKEEKADLLNDFATVMLDAPVGLERYNTIPWEYLWPWVEFLHLYDTTFPSKKSQVFELLDQLISGE